MNEYVDEFAQWTGRRGSNPGLTMGRQKLGCSPACGGQVESREWMRDREKEAERGRDSEGEREKGCRRGAERTDGTERTSAAGQRTCIICEKKRNSFTPTVFGVAIRPAGSVMTSGSIDNKIAGPMISERKGTTACRRRRSFARVH